MSAEEESWLSATEMPAWLSLINVAMRLPAKLDTQLRTDAGITHFEFMVMGRLSQEPDRRLGLTPLAAAVYSSPSRLSHVLGKLNKRGWLVRHAVGRSACAQLTDEGFAALESAARGHAAEVRRLVFDHLDEQDVAALDRVLSKLAAPLSDEA